MPLFTAGTTAIFTLINALVIRPLPGVQEPDGLVRLTNGSFSYPAFEELKKQRIFASTVRFKDRRIPDYELHSQIEFLKSGELLTGQKYTEPVHMYRE